MFKIVGLCLAGALLLVFLKASRCEYAMLLRIALLLTVSVLLLSGVRTVLSETEKLWALVGENRTLVTVMLKALGLALIAQIASDLCRDSGEQTLSGVVELAAKLGILLTALPLATQLVEMSLGWLQ